MLVNLSGQFPLRTLHEYVDFYTRIGEVLHILRPYDCGVAKTRIGGAHDGGYVMLPPETFTASHGAAAAYSFGVSEYSPWDWVMAEHGIPVYQYDGTISAPPDRHPNMFFHPYNIAAPSQEAADCKTVGQIMSDWGHTQHRNLILQIDIEGAEWQVFAEMTAEQMQCFSQIIVEWHGLSPALEGFEQRLAVLRKVAQTHTPIHVHLNNYGIPYSAQHGLLCYGDAYEVSYVRNSDFHFTECTDSFPTALDAPCNPASPDIPVGVWPALQTVK